MNSGRPVDEENARIVAALRTCGSVIIRNRRYGWEVRSEDIQQYWYGRSLAILLERCVKAVRRDV